MNVELYVQNVEKLWPKAGSVLSVDINLRRIAARNAGQNEQVTQNFVPRAGRNFNKKNRRES